MSEKKKNDMPLTAEEEKPSVPETLQGLFDSLWSENIKHEARIAELERELAAKDAEIARLTAELDSLSSL